MTVSTTVDPATAIGRAVEALALPLIAWGTVDGDGELRVIPIGQLDLVETCRRRLLKQHETTDGSPGWWGNVLAVIGEAFAPVERALWRIDRGRTASTGAGAQLDEVGAFVDRARGGLSDEDYRIAVIVDGVALFGGGTREDMVAAAFALWGARYLGIVEVWPAGQRLFALDLRLAELRLAVDLLGEVRGGGVLTVIEAWTSWVYGFDYLDGEVDPVGWVGFTGAETDIFGFVGYASLV